MATVTHGVKDGVDEILEKANAVDRTLEAMADAPGASQSRLDAIDVARSYVSELKEVSTNLRGAVDGVLKSAPR